ncbi:MAG: DUF3576 domain-containing protein [Alphaproteobacteria bacterium]|nr:DUF3576 domain-containing protein [Alphaproteobacteria bacterium]TAD89219.1 MAG: DUF3576 domain-containing protein [Alphaproteobacteria bacterium]
MTRSSLRRLWLPVTAGLLLVGCAGLQTTEPPLGRDAQDARRIGSILGDEGGFNLFGGSRRRGDDQPAGIAVNTYLWRASIDTLAFMPLVSADPFGGVILTDWHSPPDSPSERFRISVFILDRQLRADGVRVSVFRQIRDAAGWSDAQVNQRTASDIETAILTRARQLRLDSTAQRN